MKRHFDILVIGAGPAGLAAATEAAVSGAHIGIIDDNPRPGGQIWRDGPGVALPARARQLRARVEAASNIECHVGSRVVAPAGDHSLLIENESNACQVTFTKLILCTGARELLLPFPGWTLPGVTGAGGLQALIKGGLPVAGERIVVAGSGPLLLASAATARQHGARILRVAEQAGRRSVARFAAGLWRWPNKAMQALELFDRSYRVGHQIVEALGDRRLEAVRIRQGDSIEEIACDRLASGFGLIPNTGLAQLLGCHLNGPAIAVDRWQATRCANVLAAGECTGFGGSELALVEGRIAGLAAIGEHSQAERLIAERDHWQMFADALARDFALDPALRKLCRPDTLVCRCEDVAYSQLAGRDGWIDAKLASRCGMGACQGRICGGAANFMFGWPQPAARVPLCPTRLETLLQLGEPRHDSGA